MESTSSIAASGFADTADVLDALAESFRRSADNMRRVEALRARYAPEPMHRPAQSHHAARATVLLSALEFALTAEALAHHARTGIDARLEVARLFADALTSLRTLFVTLDIPIPNVNTDHVRAEMQRRANNEAIFTPEHAPDLETGTNLLPDTRASLQNKASEHSK